ncbi:MAG: hypothetical protein R3316_07595 [Rhodovibrionaceae bacterium]|nr:hypothetical protein [Rhodovibrionaceae bacterium]
MSKREGFIVCLGAALGLMGAGFFAPAELAKPTVYLFFGAFGMAGMLGGFAVNRLLEAGEEREGEEA